MTYLLDLLGLNNLSFDEFIWVSFGTLGQLIFFSRWIIQWLSSEKSKSSIIPVAFWWCSLAGGIITLVYANHIGSFPFMLAQAIGITVYSRNLLLIYRRKSEKNS
jgi:lipid-A-disaccharide synthase-like uncharacterized protein|tara:strand:+ start:275 stop:589 length:315 start_codon:yes stop_codon:yes gene_type:complete